MYGIYGDIIDAAEKALADYDEIKELLEYPEVQADKAYYLSVLSKYNELNNLKDKYGKLISGFRRAKGGNFSFNRNKFGRRTLGYIRGAFLFKEDCLYNICFPFGSSRLQARRGERILPL